MWHASVSIQCGPGRMLNQPARVERLAVKALAGVGGDTEWWTCPRGIGHLRVPVTAAEAQLIPPGCVTTDAGETGPQRPRTYR